MTAAAALTTSYQDLVNQIGLLFFGLSPTATDVITDGVAQGNQPTLILNAIRKGLNQVYYPPGGYLWSFMRPVVYINTLAQYNTGTVTVDGSGNVTLTGGTFPSNAASAYGQLWIGTAVPPYFNAGLWPVQTYTNSTHLVLANYTGPVFTTGVGYNLTFNHYALPTGFDTFCEDLTFPCDGQHREQHIQRVDELEIRRRLERDNNLPAMPRMYALTTGTYVQTSLPASTRYVTFWPVPDLIYTLYATAQLRPTMLDSVNCYPLGDEVMAGVIVEACLAAAERDINQQDAEHPDAIHSRVFTGLLAAAMAQDKMKASPDTLGVDPGQGHEHRHHRRSGQIYWQAGSGYVGYL